MTKNKRTIKLQGVTAQGVRDLNDVGPKRPRPSDTVLGQAARELSLNDRAPGRAGWAEHGLPEGFGRPL